MPVCEALPGLHHFSVLDALLVHAIRIGIKVFHAKFGDGRVQMLEGGGADARALISFTWHGAKCLALNAAKLTLVQLWQVTFE